MRSAEHGKQVTLKNAERTVKLGDVLVKGGYWPKDIVEAAQSVTQKESLLNQASTMLSWMKYGMNDKRNATDPESAVEVLTGKYGESAIKMLDKAYEVAVNSGLMHRNDAKLEEIKALATTSLANQKNYGDMVMSKMDPVWKARVKGADELANLVSTVQRIASTGGTKEDRRVMEILFPNAENRHEVQKALYSTNISSKTFGIESATNRLGQEQGEVTVGGKRLRAVEDMDGNDWMRQAEAFTDTEQSAEFEDRTVEAQRVRYIRNAGGHAFRKADATSRAAMEQAKQENKGPGSRVEEVGVVKAALDKARAENGDALSKEHRLDVLERVVRCYMKRKVPARPATPPAEASAAAKAVHAKDLAKWERSIERAAKALDRSHVVLKTVAVKEDVVSAELDYEAVRASQLDRKLDDPRNRPEEGVMWVGTKRGAKMLISAPQVLRLAFQSRGTEHQDVGFSGKTQRGDELQVNFSSAQNIYNILLRSMGDISLMPQFNGAWGFVEAGGNPVRMEGHKTLPDNFVLLKENKDRKDLTVAAVKLAKKDFSSRLSELTDADLDPSEIGQPTRRMQANVWQKLNALRAHLQRMIVGEEREKLDRMLTTLEGVSKRRFEEGWRGDDLIPVGYHKVIGKWMAALNLKAGTVNVADACREAVRAVDGLGAYDPQKSIVRGDQHRGFVTTQNIGMQAQTVIGTSKKLEEVGLKSLTGPLPTKKTPNRAEDKVRATQQEAARQRFIELLLAGMGEFESAVPKMSVRELVLFAQANSEFKALISKCPHGIAKGYLGGDLIQARLIVARLGNSADSIDAVIDAAIRKNAEELGDGVEYWERGYSEAFGEGRQVDVGRKKARVAESGDRARASGENELGAGKSRWHPQTGRVSDERIDPHRPEGIWDRRPCGNSQGYSGGASFGNISAARFEVPKSSGWGTGTDSHNRQCDGNRNAGEFSQEEGSARASGEPGWEVVKKNLTETQQLQAYLEQFSSKSAVWAGAAHKALSEGKEKQIAGALTYAKRQFGEIAEIPVDSGVAVK